MNEPGMTPNCANCGDPLKRISNRVSGFYCAHCPQSCHKRKLPRKRTCRTCGKQFKKSARHFYCSPECWPSKYKARPQIEKSCLSCGKTFKGHGNRIKCDDCAPATYKSKPPTLLECEICKSEFLGRPGRKTCSDSCDKTLAKARYRFLYNYRVPLRDCADCGVPFRSKSVVPYCNKCKGRRARALWLENRQTRARIVALERERRRRQRENERLALKIVEQLGLRL